MAEVHGEVQSPHRPRFHAYSVGDFRASACTNMTDDVALATLTLEYPDLWRVSDDQFGEGIPNGTECPDGLVGCRHVLFDRGPMPAAHVEVQ